MCRAKNTQRKFKWLVQQDTRQCAGKWQVKFICVEIKSDLIENFFFSVQKLEEIKSQSTAHIVRFRCCICIVIETIEALSMQFELPNSEIMEFCVHFVAIFILFKLVWNLIVGCLQPINAV